MASSDSDSQGPIFWERLRGLFVPGENGQASSNEPRRGVAIAMCTLISFVIWFTFTLMEPSTVTLHVPTRVVGVPEGQALSEMPPASVDVQVQGEGLQLLRLYYDRPFIPINAQEDAIEVSRVLDFPESMDIQVENINPQRIDLKKDPLVTRRVPVRLRSRVETPPAFELLSPPRPVPDSVDISGARSIVEGIEAWPTDSLIVVGLRDSTTRRVPLRDTLTALVSRDPERIRVSLEAGKFAEASREIEVEVTGVPSDQDLVTLEPSTVRVEYRVLFDQLFDSQRAQDFFATVPYDQIRSDTSGSVRPQLHLPSDLSIRNPKVVPPRLRYYMVVSEN